MGALGGTTVPYGDAGSDSDGDSDTDTDSETDSDKEAGPRRRRHKKRDPRTATLFSALPRPRYNIG